MVTDKETNYLFLADTLTRRYPYFATQLEEELVGHHIPCAFLPKTSDIWAVDFMPIQVKKDKFIQFIYAPDYLNHHRWRDTISDVDSICDAIKLKSIKSNIVLDGGNVVKGRNKVILCEKVFKENLHYTKGALIKALKEDFETSHLIFVPPQPYDRIGHADGMIRFIDDNTVLVNDYRKESKRFRDSFLMSLKRAGLTFVELPYNPYHNTTLIDATGTYINYLEMNNIILVPTFGMEEDEDVIRSFEAIFNRKTIRALRSNEIAKEGGALNCISWNIKM